MTSPWVQSYKFVTENAGRFANDIAMGTVIHICDEKCWSLCRWLRHGYRHTNWFDVEKNCVKHPSTKGAEILACVEWVLVGTGGYWWVLAGTGGGRVRGAM